LNNADYKHLLPRAVNDLSAASYAGVLIYVTLFVTIIYATGYQSNHPALTTACIWALSLVSVARLLLASGSRTLAPHTWVRWFMILTILMVSIWSGYWATVIHLDGLNTTTLLSIAASVGIASAGIGTLAPMGRLSFAVLVILLWPSGLVLSSMPDGVGTAYAIMFLTASVFLSFVAWRLNRQYWALQKNASLLEERAAQLTEATQAKSDFLARMSHEIRTPLNGILGMTQMLQLSDLAPEQRKYTNIIRHSGDALLRIINDILDLSRIEAGKLILISEPFDLAAIVNETLDLLEPEATDRGLPLHRNISTQLPPQLMGDAGRLRQILTNLVGNAIKFTKTGSVSVTVTAGPLLANHMQVCIEVCDTGIGIPARDRQQVFEAFNQGDDATMLPAGGTGLGLAITRQLVDLMPATLSIRSNADGQGTVFSLNLSLALVTQPQATQTAGVSKAPPEVHDNVLRDKAILVAEDNPVNRLFATEVLRHMGCRVTSVNDGIQAVEAHRTGRFDAILMDIQMPGLDGIDATRAIRTVEGMHAHTPIIAITANALKGEQQHCIDAGLDDFISKPYNLDELQTVLRRWVVAATPVTNKHMH
jgi:signal transduction histidine kinase/ActR/RegA family two-component response regulator